LAVAASLPAAESHDQNCVALSGVAAAGFDRPQIATQRGSREAEGAQSWNSACDGAQVRELAGKLRPTGRRERIEQRILGMGPNPTMRSAPSRPMHRTTQRPRSDLGLLS
jgi:hypothetical protein